MTSPFGGMPAWENQLFVYTMMNNISQQNAQRAATLLQAEANYRARWEYQETARSCAYCGCSKVALVGDNRTLVRRTFWRGREVWDLVDIGQGNRPNLVSIYCWRCRMRSTQDRDNLEPWERELVQ